MFIDRTNCGYSLMVKFLLAKENMRVRFPLPAFSFYIFYIYDYLTINYLLIIIKIKKSTIFFYIYFSLSFFTLYTVDLFNKIYYYCKFYTFSGDGI